MRPATVRAGTLNRLKPVSALAVLKWSTQSNNQLSLRSLSSLLHCQLPTLNLWRMRGVRGYLYGKSAGLRTGGNQWWGSEWVEGGSECGGGEGGEKCKRAGIVRGRTVAWCGWCNLTHTVMWPVGVFFLWACEVAVSKTCWGTGCLLCWCLVDAFQFRLLPWWFCFYTVCTCFTDQVTVDRIYRSSSVSLC